MTTPEAPAERVLARAQALAEPALRAAVHEMPAPLRHIAGYHLGWWDERTRPLPDGDPPLRGALALLCGQAVGGRPASALPAAVAVELLNGFAQLHAGVLGGADRWRARPAAWAVFGTAQAILAGDSLLAMAMNVLAADRTPVSARALHELAATLQDLCAGTGAGDQIMVVGRSAPLLGCACSLGALYGGGTLEQIRLLRMFGERLDRLDRLVAVGPAGPVGPGDAVACLDAALALPRPAADLAALAELVAHGGLVAREED